MTNQVNRKIVLAARPDGEPRLSDFAVVTEPINETNEGQVLLRILYLSLDPYMRNRMDAELSYARPLQIGEVMCGDTIAQVVASRNPGFQRGQIVLSKSGWQEYDLSDGSDLKKINPDIAPITTALGVLGMPGMTAYTGLLNIGRPKPGETVVVAAATGPVGSAVGQIAKICGARAVAIAGGQLKCEMAVSEFGFDHAIDHQQSGFKQALGKACTDGIDVYFESVGGHIWEAVQPLLNRFARVPVCGLIAHYNDWEHRVRQDRLPLLMRTILYNRVTLRGFIVTDFHEQESMFLHDMSNWISEKRVKYREDCVEDLSNAPAAFIGMLRGENLGKLIVRVANTEV